jgi:hypothetical protein
MKTLEAPVKQIKPTKAHARKIIELLSHGLTKGLRNVR